MNLRRAEEITKLRGNCIWLGSIDERIFAGAEVDCGFPRGLEGFVGMDFIGKAFACTLLAVAELIGHGKRMERLPWRWVDIDEI